MRPRQWVKNLFILIPAFFDGKILCSDCLIAAVWAFILFSLTSGSVYCLNDIVDAEADRNHPVKCRRPVASGAVSVKEAGLIMAVLLAGAAAVAGIVFAGNIAVWIIIGSYLVMNILYTFRLKNYAITDVFIIATGFVLRLVLGGVVCGIWLSPWIVCMTFLLALFLAFAKRRDDVILIENSGKVTRKNVTGYNLAFMNQTIGLTGTVTMVCYIIYSVSPEVEERLGCGYIYISSVFVLAGILRYLQLTIVYGQSGSPTRLLLTDRFLQLCILAWILFFIVVIYVL